MRSHYGRRDLQGLFELQPRAAQKLLELLPTVAVGTSRLVEREVLADFLSRVHEADDVSNIFEAYRQERTQNSRRRLRSLVPHDETPVSIDCLPRSLTLSRGRLQVDFATVEELAAAMYWLARVLQAEGEQFGQRFEALPPASDSRAQQRLSNT